MSGVTAGWLLSYLDVYGRPRDWRHAGAQADLASVLRAARDHLDGEHSAMFLTNDQI